MGLITTSVDTLKRYLLMSFIITAIVTVGNIISASLPWQYLGYLFYVIRFFLYLFDFIINIDTLVLLVGIALFMEGAIWTVRGVLFLISVVGWNR